MAKWSFRKKEPGEKSRNPMQDEFFASNTEAGSLVREAIQNSLDAILDKNKPVKIRFYISDSQNSLSHEKSKKYFDDSVWNHFTSKGSGLIDLPNADDSCSYLVYEDFNTKGLNGDIYQDSEKDDNKNSFYYFLRAEGQSDKSADELGSWGVGKIVFPMSSRLRSIFVLTTRSEDKKMLLAGQSTLKCHAIGDEVYTPDGWFGDIDNSGLGLPVDDLNIINEFKEGFNLQRCNDDTGLSVVMPWLDEHISFGSISESVIREYFYPIMHEKLIVEVESSTEKIALNHNTILDEVQKIDSSDDRKLINIVEMAGTILTQPEEKIITLKKYCGNKPEWQPEMVTDKVASTIRDILNDMQPVVINIPLVITYKSDSKPTQTYFEIVLKRVEGLKSSPVFVRDGLVVTKVRRPKCPGYSALVIIKDTPLKDLLGKAENPAHTEWNEGSNHYKGQYVYGKSYLDYIRLSVKKITEYLLEDDEEADLSVLADLFSIPNPDDVPAPEPKPTKDKDTEVLPPEVPPIIPKKRYYKLDKVEDGFFVKGNQAFDEERIFRVEVAYDILRGDPFKKWHPADFDLSKLDIFFNKINIVNIFNNVIEFSAKENEFYLSVRGFDQNRDIKVKVSSRSN